MGKTTKKIFTNIKKIALVFVLTSTLNLALPAVAAAQTQAWSGNCVGGAKNDVATIQGLGCLIANVFSVILTVIGLAGFVMMFVGAFQWLVSAGSTKGIESARNTITYALVGLVVAISAFIILNLISSFTGISSITRFVIPDSSTGL